MSLGFILRLAWRDWRGGELGLLVIALMVAVGTVTAVSLFVDRLHQALLKESATFLAADRYIGSSAEIPDEFRQAARDLGLETADTLSFPSMVFTEDDKNSLVSIKAVGPGYPLRGVLRVTDVPFTPPTVTTELPEPGEVWLDGRLFPSLAVELGDQVEVGYAKLTISKVLTSEPDRGGSMYDLGPRLLMRIEDVPATQVVQPGSRLSYRLLLRGKMARWTRSRISWRWMKIRISGGGESRSRARPLVRRSTGQRAFSCLAACWACCWQVSQWRFRPIAMPGVTTIMLAF